MKSLIISYLSLLLLLPGCEKMEAEGDVTFAKTTFEALVRGDSDVAGSIDWETLNSLGIPVGQQYVSFENEADRTNFRKGFITQFSASFRESGGSMDSFSNWRVASHDGAHTEVAADSSTGTLKLTVSQRNGAERLSAIEIDR
jgi:hypothetical protein